MNLIIYNTINTNINQPFLEEINGPVNNINTNYNHPDNYLEKIEFPILLEIMKKIF